jgi:hypothetical protein
MINEIKLFLFVLSIVYTIRFLFEFVFKLFQENPEQLMLRDTEKIFLYLSTSYIITYFLI